MDTDGAGYPFPPLLDDEADHVLMDVGQGCVLGTEGEYGWGGAASTYFWIDPSEAFIGIQMAQFQPSGYHLIGQDFRTVAYQAIVD